MMTDSKNKRPYKKSVKNINIPIFSIPPNKEIDSQFHPALGNSKSDCLTYTRIFAPWPMQIKPFVSHLSAICQPLGVLITNPFM